ncbi:MAG: enoyl-CoA hydratase/isomerase family protein [Myxococcales bacterium]|jgi:enoyl-CoA hydratase|nr:enoyl-CoA hydratase/isomerase family protein [Myxococcales bacterium]
MGPHNLKLDIDQDGIALLTIDREAQLNALDTATLRELKAALLALADMCDPAPRVLIITGAGRAFVSGADIAEMARLTPTEALDFAELGHEVMDLIEALPFPTIAAVNGFALGGGCELALACDLVFASHRAKFAQPEVGLGIMPGFGGTQRLVRAIGLQRARNMIFTGEPITAARAVEMGLALEAILPDELLEHCRKVARKIATKAPLALAQAKRTVNAGADVALTTGCALERQAFALLFGTHDQREGMSAHLEKRRPEFKGR